MNSDVLTRSCDAARSGANLAETTFTPAAVRTRGIRTALTLRTPDDPRLEAQPLYVAGLQIRGKVRNVIYQATMGNTVYAWDADSGEELWKTNVGKPVTGSNDIDAYLVNITWGILSTPVIDRQAGVLYACAWVSADGTGKWQTAVHLVVALDIVTGATRHPALNLHGATATPGHGLPVQKFSSQERKQRAALALVKGAVVVSFGTIQETSQTARGWVIAVDAASWKIAACWTSTARGSGGGIWMSGSGPAVQGDGSIWVVTGNGDFDGQVDWGQCVVRLRYDPPAHGAQGKLAVTGWWSPWTDKARTAPRAQAAPRAAPAALAKLPKATNFRAVPHLARAGVAAMDMGGAWGDQDLGASGIVLLEAEGIALVSSKDGILYTIDIATPGDTTPADLAPAPAAAAGNYAKLAAPPILYTYYDPGMDPATPDPRNLNWLSGNRTRHLHGTPLAWTSQAHGRMHFCGGENGNLRAWRLTPAKTSAYLGCSAEFASAQVTEAGGGMPGWSLALSANGAHDGVVWAMIPYGDANRYPTNCRLLAYDAAQLATWADGSGALLPLWDSQAWNWNFLHPKFNRPVAVGGKLLVPTYDGRVLVITLA